MPRYTVFSMTTAILSPLDEVTSLVGRLASDARELVQAPFWKLSGDELLDLGRSLESLTRTIWSAQVHLVDELDQTGAAAARSVSSTAALIRDAFRIAPGEAGNRVAAARAILPQDLPSGGEIPARCPELASAVNAGRLDGDHVRTVLSTLRRLPDDLLPEVVEAAERTLVDHAVQHDAADFRKVARHLEAVLNTDGTPPNDEAARSKIEFAIGQRSVSTGLTRIYGWLDDLGIATLRAVIDPLSAPKPASDGRTDLRPAATRRAQALIEALTFVADHSDSVLPDSKRERPHITVTLDWDMIRQQASAATVDGHLLSAGDARRLLCDARVIPAVLTGRSEILDLGRASRTFPAPLRRAITVRDRGCAWPGCDRPPSWCDTHHVNWWQRDLGDTSYANGVLLCSYHHSEIHRSDWQIQFATRWRTGVHPATVA